MTIQEIEALGFTYKRNVKDSLGHSHRIGLYPLNRPGGTNYFESLTELRAFLESVKFIRAIEEGDNAYLTRQKNKHYARLGLYNLMEQS